MNSKLLILTEHFLPLKGGSIKWLLNTYNRFGNSEVLFVAGSQNGDEDIDVASSYRVERIPMHMSDWDPTRPSSLRRYLKMVSSLLRISHKNNIQQIHCAKVLPEALVAWLIKHIATIPYIVYAHGEEITVGLTSRKFQWLLPRIYNGAAAIIANSSNTRVLLEGIGIKANKIHLIHPGVDAEFYGFKAGEAEVIRNKYRLGTSPVILTVGRMQRRKGQDMVIKALPRIKEKFPAVKYIIVGTGEESRYLRTLAHNFGVADVVIFAGRVPDEDLPAYYSTCDVFVMPNREIDGDIEGFGMVYLEANAARKPVIGGISGGTGDAIVHGVTGLRVDGTDVKAITDSVISLLKNHAEAKAMGEAGRRRVEEEFKWESVAKRTIAISNSIETK